MKMALMATKPMSLSFATPPHIEQLTTEKHWAYQNLNTFSKITIVISLIINLFLRSMVEHVALC